jgi:hypothetical protein
MIQPIDSRRLSGAAHQPSGILLLDTGNCGNLEATR